MAEIRKILAKACETGLPENFQRVVKEYGLTAGDIRAQGGVLLSIACWLAKYELALWLAETFQLTAKDLMFGKLDNALCFVCNCRIPEGCDYKIADLLDRFAASFHPTTEDVRTNGNHLLRFVCDQGRLEVFEWLITRFDLTLEDARAEDNEALHYVFYESSLFEFAKRFIAHFKIELCDIRSRGNAILQRLCWRGCFKELQWLVENFELTPEDIRSNDNMALRHSSWYGHLDIVMFLTTTFGLTSDDARSVENDALRSACSHGNVEVAKWLTKTFGLTVEDIRAKKNEALENASHNGHLDVVEWILQTFELTAEDTVRAFRSACMCQRHLIAEKLAEKFKFANAVIF